MKLAIGIPTTEMARYAVFYDYFNLMDKPVGTMIMYTHGQSPAKGRNLVIEQAIAQECSHLLFIDDDVLVPKDLVEKLAAHDLDIVSAFISMRNYPNKPLLFDETFPDGRCKHFFPLDSDEGLKEIVACGLGACLIKIDVFKKMSAPWIRLGELEPDGWCDDIGFFRRVREAGIKIHVDLDTVCGHMAAVAVWPNKNEGKWLTTYDSFGQGRVAFPMVRPEIKKPELVGVVND